MTKNNLSNMANESLTNASAAETSSDAATAQTNQQKQGFSRRSFLTGAAAAGALAVAGLAGCSPQNSSTGNGSGTTGTSTSGTATSGKWSWETAPAAITNFAETIDTEILIIGAGISGLATAAAAAEEGGKVLVVEKCAQFNGRGGGFGAINSRYMEQVGATFDKPDAYGHWVAQTGSRSTESLIAKFFRDSERASNWILDKIEAVGGAVMVGDFFSKDTVWSEVPGYHMAFLMTPPGENPPEGFEYNPFLPATCLYNDSLKAGAEYMFNAPAVQLIKEGGKVTGAIVETDKGTYTRINASKGVVLATGDISGDEEMVEAYAPIALPLPLKRSQYTPQAVGSGWNSGAAVNNGEGHKMALWAGAQMVDGPCPTMMHPQAFTWFHAAFLFVNTEGKRFFCEDTWVQGKSNNMVRQPDQMAFSIFDNNWLKDIEDTVGFGGGMFWDSFRAFGTPTAAAADSFKNSMFGSENPAPGAMSYLEAGKDPSVATDTLSAVQAAWQADTLEELAELIHVPVDTFLETVERYNKLCEAKSDIDFFKEPTFLTPIKEAPFFATKVGPAILAIPAGLKCDDDFRCLDASGKPIDGLYVAGNMVGSVIAVDYPINVAGNSHGRCITFGYDLGKQLVGKYEPALKPGDPMPGLKLGTVNRWTAEGFPKETTEQ
ncbi:MAG: FAD-dependent oxidoreductase [Coriobacteriales bacterium]|jgi:succinate dehydrogenase/fumarate reductase flavoprotein subunit|nr:FAD-dependent oxidoreductase [Coriobacteriales bacterium]